METEFSTNPCRGCGEDRPLYLMGVHPETRADPTCFQCFALLDSVFYHRLGPLPVPFGIERSAGQDAAYWKRMAARDSAWWARLQAHEAALPITDEVRRIEEQWIATIRGALGAAYVSGLRGTPARDLAIGALRWIYPPAEVETFEWAFTNHPVRYRRRTNVDDMDIPSQSYCLFH